MGITESKTNRQSPSEQEISSEIPTVISGGERDQICETLPVSFPVAFISPDNRCNQSRVIKRVSHLICEDQEFFKISENQYPVNVVIIDFLPTLDSTIRALKKLKDPLAVRNILASMYQAGFDEPITIPIDGENRNIPLLPMALSGSYKLSERSLLQDPDRPNLYTLAGSPRITEFLASLIDKNPWQDEIKKGNCLNPLLESISQIFRNKNQSVMFFLDFPPDFSRIYERFLKSYATIVVYSMHRESFTDPLIVAMLNRNEPNENSRFLGFVATCSDEGETLKIDPPFEQLYYRLWKHDKDLCFGGSTIQVNASKMFQEDGKLCFNRVAIHIMSCAGIRVELSDKKENLSNLVVSEQKFSRPQLTKLPSWDTLFGHAGWSSESTQQVYKKIWDDLAAPVEDKRFQSEYDPDTFRDCD